MNIVDDARAEDVEDEVAECGLALTLCFGWDGLAVLGVEGTVLVVDELDLRLQSELDGLPDHA